MGKLKNNKGFVLIETIVVVVFITGVFTFLFTNVLPIFGEYERMESYDLIEDKYNAHMIRKMILKDDECKVRNLLTLNGVDYYHFEGDEMCMYLDSVNYCKMLLSEDYLDVKEIILTNYTVKNLKKVEDEEFSRNLNEYIQYMPDYSKKSNLVQSYDYAKRLIVVFNDGRITNIEILKSMDYNRTCNACSSSATDVVDEDSILARGTTDNTFLNGQLLKKNVESITFKNTTTVPTDALGSWDASYEKNGSVNAWYYDSDSNGLYEVYIGGNGKVYANANSRYLFYNFTNLKTLDLTYLDTSSVTNMEEMFSGCSNLTTINVSGFNTSKVVNMSGMFKNCTKLTTLSLTNFVTTNVTNMQSMFEGASALTTLDVSSFSTSKVTDMSRMFYGCKKLTTLSISNFTTTSVTNMAYMFANLELTTLNIDNFDTPKVVNFEGMFLNSNKLTSVSMKKLTFAQKNVYYKDMFKNVDSGLTVTVGNEDAETKISSVNSTITIVVEE